MSEDMEFFEYVRKNRRRSMWHKFVRVMACIVVFCTTYALILPAITMESQTWCGYEEHIHDETCLNQLDTVVDAQLECELGALGVHAHTDSCRDSSGVLICGYADYVIHTHSEVCTDASGNLICMLPEVTAHIHSDACYSIPEAEVHDHSEACYEVTRGAQTCTLEEKAGHAHEKACYGSEGTLVCGQEEHAAYAHSDTCYTVETVTICGMESHPHTDACFTPKTLNCTEEEHSHSAACYAEPALTCGTEIHDHSEGCYTDGELTCGREVHAHGSGCYAEAELICGKSVHAHGDGCYTAPVQICGLDSHPHTDDCYSEVKTLICEKVETEGHTHSDACYEYPLICTLAEEEGHQHTDDCFERIETLICDEDTTTAALEPVLSCGREEICVHIHDDSCLDDAGNRVCGLLQIQEHVHTEACMTQAQELPLVCELEENEEHQHSEMCYGTWGYDCGMEEHSHTLACFSNPEADVETAEVWNQMLAGVELTGSFADDLAAIAKTQLGYAESGKNYQVLEDGETMKGYTRYGAWAGTPYADWNALFVAFCMDYAKVPGEVFPTASTAAQWVEALSDSYYDLYYAADSGYLPKTGDVAFLHIAESENETEEEKKIPNFMGIVLECTDTELTIAAGDSDNMVKKVKISLSDSSLLGYGEVFAMPMLGVTLDEPRTGGTYTAKDGDITITLTIDPNYINGSDKEKIAGIKLVPVTGEDAANIVNKVHGMLNCKKIDNRKTYKIQFVDESGTVLTDLKINTANAMLQIEGSLNDKTTNEQHVFYQYDKDSVSEMQNNMFGNNAFSEELDAFLIDFVSVDPTKIEEGTHYDCLTFMYNNQKDAFIYNPAYSDFYNPNMPLGTAGNFHLVGFGTVNLNSHTNGNILAHTLRAGNNFGTNQKNDSEFKELHYVQNYEIVNSGSSADPGHGVNRPELDYLVIGSSNTVEINSKQGFKVNGVIVERPKNLVQDENTASAPFIDLYRVEREIRDISNHLDAYPDITNTAEFVINIEENNNYLELKNPNNIGVWHVTAEDLTAKVTTPLAIKGFSNQGSGAVIINVDMAGWPAGTEFTLPEACVWVDGEKQSASETQDFSAGKVIWNFTNADGKTIKTQIMTGMVVAPGATVNISQNLNGTVVAENINVNAESHRTDFVGKIYKNEFINTAHIHVHKVDRENYGHFLAGAQFKLFEYKNGQNDSIDNENSWQLAKQYKLENGKMVTTSTDQDKTTDSEGVVLFEGLKPDTLYKLVEVQAPAGYHLDGNPRYLYFKKDVDAPWNLDYLNTEAGSNCVHYQFTNEKNEDTQTSIKVKKNWIDTNNNTLTEAPQDTVWFKVVQYKKTAIENSNPAQYTLEATGQKWTYSVKAADNWEREVTPLPQTTDNSLVYKVEEISVPGYTTTYANNDGQSDPNTVIQITNTQMPDWKYAPLSVQKNWQTKAGTGITDPPDLRITFDLYQIKSQDPQGRYYNPENKTHVTTGVILPIIDANNSMRTWTWSYTNNAADEAADKDKLPVYGKENGISYYYFYYVQETKVERMVDNQWVVIDGYSPSYGGDLVVDGAGVIPNNGKDLTAEDSLDLTINNTETTSIRLEKAWKDKDNKDKNDPGVTSVQVQILRKTPSMTTWEEFGDPVTISNGAGTQDDNSDNWKATISNLPVYSPRGELYSYKCEELHVPGYITSYVYTTDSSSDQAVTRDLATGIPANASEGKMQIVNKQADVVELTIEKLWKKNSTEVIPPDQTTITVDIVMNKTVDGHGKQEVYKQITLPVTVTNDDGTVTKVWTHTETGLPTKDADGNSITYTVSEHDISGWKDDYTTEQTDEGTKIVITNTAVPTRTETSVTVNKKWFRKNSQTEYTPDTGSITFDLVQTATTRPVGADADDLVYVEFVNFDKLSTTGYPGQTLTYLFEYVKTNDQNPGWNNTYSVRYTSEEGQEKLYSKDVASPTVTENKYELTVQFVIPKDIKITDSNGIVQKKVRIESFNVQGGGGDKWTYSLVSSGGGSEPTTSTHTISAVNNWTTTIGALPLRITDPFQITEYSYSVVEKTVNDTDAANDYTVSYDKNANVFTIKNTDKVNKTDLTVEKKWFKDGAQTNAVQGSITFKLYQKCGDSITGYSYGGQNNFTLSGPDSWSMTFKDLPLEKLENGNTVQCSYFVVEQPDVGMYGVTTTYSVGTNADAVVEYTVEADTKVSGSAESTGDTIIIKNTIPSDSYELPSTGSIGTMPYTLCGLAMLLCGAVLFLLKRRQIL